MKLKCPNCGFEGEIGEFSFIYETTIYVVEKQTLSEERERPILVICPRCGEGFFLESPYSKVRFSGKPYK
jgi:ribosomal protein S27AE